MADNKTYSLEESFEPLASQAATREIISVHWRAVFAGVFIALLVHFMLMMLGLGVGGSTFRDWIAGNSTLQSFGTGVGIWTAVSAIVALFAGSYLAGRVSGIVVTRVGYTQGAVIASLFFAVMISQIGLGVSAIGSGLGSIARNVTNEAIQVAQDPRIQAMTEDLLGDLNLNSPTETVVTGLLSRLIHNDQGSAITYLAQQSNISTAEATTRLTRLNTSVHNAIIQFGETSAKATELLGWSAFITLLLATLSALFGGAIGAQVNMRNPITSLDRRALPGFHRAPLST